ncbi:MAG: ACP S-malonyltransferase [Woeseia sp.]
MTFAIVFPGQGSQSPGMQKSLASEYPVVEQTYREASDVLGLDLWALVQSGPHEELDRTVITQPAMLAAGVSAWRAWQAAGGIEPAILAGHSLGEYSALVCAGALDFADAVTLVRQRAELMQQAVPEGSGGMAAILGLDDDAVIDVCRRAAEGQVVSAVNFNSPGQVVIAGDRAAVERAVEQAKAAGARRAMLLPVSVPSHCELMIPAADRLALELAETPISAPRVPVVNNVDVAIYKDASQIRDGLVRQLHNPVRWVETVQTLVAAGAGCILECGPGKVLTGLLKRIDRNVTGIGIDDPESLQKAIDASQESAR